MQLEVSRQQVNPGAPCDLCAKTRVMDCLQSSYGFTCRCERCQLEEGLPPEAQERLQSLEREGSIVQGVGDPGGMEHVGPYAACPYSCTHSTTLHKALVYLVPT